MKTLPLDDPAAHTAAPSVPMLAVDDLACGYGTRAILHDISLRLAAGEMVALLGRNGCGKSTLLRSLGGALPPLSGAVRLRGTPLGTLPRRTVAREMAVVAQELQVPFAFSVREVVELGRAPYARFMAPPDAQDARAVETALAVADLTGLAERTFQQLSGGEQQRVAVAMALAQDPSLLLLDEPTVHLDLAHQMALLGLIRRLCAERGLAALAAMHDINLAALYFDRLIVLGEGTILAVGTPQEVIREALIERAFGTRVAVARHPTMDVPQVSLLPRSD